MFSLLYNMLLVLLFVGLSPKILYQYLLLGKYRKSLKERFGYGFDNVRKGERRLFWIHLPSLGETKAIVSLAKKIRERNPEVYLLITSTTETGHEESKKSLCFADKHLYLPFDFGWIIRPIVRFVKPDLLLLCESDFWYNFLDECKLQGAKVCLVNGKLSIKSLKRYLQFSYFSKSLFSKIDLFCLQSQRYLERFMRLGISSDKLIVTGNLKFDNSPLILSANDIMVWKNKLKIEAKDLIVVAGSTHSPEEEILLDVFDALWKQFPHIKLFLLPRHPDRFLEVANLLKNRKISFCKYSEAEKCAGNEKVILIDALGILNHCYQLADIAFVGGSFTEKVGGHNILEPCNYGKPVLYGEHMHTQLDLVDCMKEFNGGIQTTPEEITGILRGLITSKLQREEIGKGGLTLINAMQGSSERTFCLLEKNFTF